MADSSVNGFGAAVGEGVGSATGVRVGAIVGGVVASGRGCVGLGAAIVESDEALSLDAESSFVQPTNSVNNAAASATPISGFVNVIPQSLSADKTDSQLETGYS
ncbi:MAG TPA: hypothetical protein VFS30_02170 [Dehalococcoidia bacterium]|nr:hypothetical protein [Dehalococcoidia bacterium]